MLVGRHLLESSRAAISPAMRTRSGRLQKTISPPCRSTPATFTLGESSGMTITARTPKRRAAHASA
jgi:hypothetical protein